MLTEGRFCNENQRKPVWMTGADPRFGRGEGAATFPGTFSSKFSTYNLCRHMTKMHLSMTKDSNFLKMKYSF